MTVNIQKSGTDLATLLAPIGSFPAISNTGVQSGGVDIAQIFAPVAYGTAYGTTTHRWRAIDSAANARSG